MTRAPNLDVHEVPDGYIIYQRARDSVCYLNKIAAVVFEFCDARLEADDIVTRVAKMFNLDVSAQAEIRTCIDSLLEEELIQCDDAT